jgi:hypothetical protein
MRTLLLALLSMLVLPGVAWADTFGTNPASHGGSNDVISAQNLSAFGPFSPASNGTATSVSFYLGDITDANLTFGLYSDSSGPVTRLGDTAGQKYTIDSSGQWATQNFDSPVAVTAGTNYWIAFNGDAITRVWYGAHANGWDYVLSVYSHGVLPTPFPSFGTGGIWVSCYVTYTPTTTASGAPFFHGD